MGSITTIISNIVVFPPVILLKASTSPRGINIWSTEICRFDSVYFEGE